MIIATRLAETDAGWCGGFAAPGVVVSYTDDPDIRSGRKFAEKGMQIAAGVPLQVGEGAEFSTFRLGLFGLDKLKDVDGTVARLTRFLAAFSFSASRP